MGNLIDDKKILYTNKQIQTMKNQYQIYDISNNNEDDDDDYNIIFDKKKYNVVFKI